MTEADVGDVQFGQVKWFSDDKGYGFIEPDEGEEDVFFHYSAIEGDGYKTVEDGARVSYRAEKGEKGWKATEVVP